MAICKTSDPMLRNGLRYQVLDWAGENFKLSRINDDAQLLGEPFVVGKAVVAEKLRLTHALCYFRRIRGQSAGLCGWPRRITRISASGT